ncbi:MAG: hypothetical protein U0175_26475 [Caldilineaceae bacterium]
MRQARSVVLILSVALLSFLVWRMMALPLFSSTLRLSAAIPFSADTPTGYDPLTEHEQKLAISAALQKEANLQASDAGSLETLLVERHEVPKAERTKGQWSRQADVYLYDYTSDTLHHSTVDVASGAVVATEKATGVQLPLTQQEEARALSLVRNDPTVWSDLTNRYHTISGEALNDLAQLQVKVSLFRSDSMPDRVNDAASACGQHRCAQALIFTVDRTLLEIMPIVDLSQGRVVQVLNETN